MPVILFVDMLGARKKWQSGGVVEAKRAFDHFASMVIASIQEEQPRGLLQGGLETDSAMFVFESPLPALLAARRLFRWAFFKGRVPTTPRLWLRGSLVRHDDEDFLRRESHARNPNQMISITTYSRSALDAISIEKSGFKGMRLVMRSNVVDQATREYLRIRFGRYSFVPVRKLQYSGYPKIQDGEFHDYLWMACKDEREWLDIEMLMNSRLRYASKDPDEFAQAAATQVVFHECGAIRRSVFNKARKAERVYMPNMIDYAENE